MIPEQWFQKHSLIGLYCAIDRMSVTLCIIGGFLARSIFRRRIIKMETRVVSCEIQNSENYMHKSFLALLLFSQFIVVIFMLKIFFLVYFNLLGFLIYFNLFIFLVHIVLTKLVRVHARACKNNILIRSIFLCGLRIYAKFVSFPVRRALSLFAILGGRFIRSLSWDLTAFLPLGRSRSGPDCPQPTFFGSYFVQHLN